MKLKNPDLRTSFYFTRYGEKRYIFFLEVTVDYCKISEKFSYHLKGVSFGVGNYSLGMSFDTADEAFIMADRICSAYPPIYCDVDNSHLDEYPEINMEDFLK